MAAVAVMRSNRRAHAWCADLHKRLCLDTAVNPVSDVFSNLALGHASLLLVWLAWLVLVDWVDEYSADIAKID